MPQSKSKHDAARWLRMLESGQTIRSIAASEGVTIGVVSGAINRARGYKKRRTKSVAATGVRKQIGRPDLRRPERAGISILEVTDKLCRFPVTHDRPHQFCGKETERGRPYCREHCKIAYAVE